jgi:hypothetical protein
MPRTKGSRKGIKRYPVFYHVRVSEKTREKLKKLGSKKIRKILEDI